MSISKESDAGVQFTVLFEDGSLPREFVANCLDATVRDLLGQDANHEGSEKNTLAALVRHPLRAIGNFLGHPADEIQESQTELLAESGDSWVRVLPYSRMIGRTVLGGSAKMPRSWNGRRQIRHLPHVPGG